jgi:hypothetical protein
VLQNYPVCEPGIPGTQIIVSGPENARLTDTVIFDTGTPTMILDQSSNGILTSPLPIGGSVQLTIPSLQNSLFTYSYSSPLSEIYTTGVGVGSQAIVGIGYFTTNYLFIDFDTSIEGWK